MCFKTSVFVFQDQCLCLPRSCKTLAVKEDTRAKCFLASLYCLQAENGIVNSMQPPTEDGAIDDGDEDGDDTAHGMDVEQGNQVRPSCLLTGAWPALL